MSNNAFNQIKDGLESATIITITDTQGVITYVNKGFCKISKFTPEELIGKTHKITNSGFHQRDFFKTMWETITCGQVWQGEICSKAKDGSVYWTHSTLIPIKNQHGEITQYFSMRHDITRQKEKDFNYNLLKNIQLVLFGKQADPKRIQDEICKILISETYSEWAFIKIYENTNDNITQNTTLPKIWSRNKYSNDGSIIQFSNSDLSNDKDTIDFIQWTIGLFQPFVFQYTNKPISGLPKLTQNGHLKNFVGLPIMYGSKKIGVIGIANSEIDWFANRVYGLSTSITAISQIIINSQNQVDKENAFKELQIQENQLRNFIKYLPVPAAIIDKEHKVLELSNDWLRTFDWPTTNIINKSIWSLFKNYPKEWEKLIEEAFKGKSLKSNEEQFTTQFGRTLWIEWTVRPWVNGGQIGGVVIIINNLTEQKDLYQEIEQLKYKQIFTSKMASLGEIAGGIAHEINNPLTIIVGVAEKLRRCVEANKITPELLIQSSQKIHTTTDRIASIIKGLKSFARDADKDPIISYSLNQILLESKPYIETKLNKFNIELRNLIPNDLIIDCRPVQLSQVLVNLINNACDAIENFPEKWISIEVEEETNGVSIKVKDSGSGIPKIVADRIMEPFFTTKDIGKGTGLGLSITKSIIESHRGLLFLDYDSPNTCFVIRLPKTQFDTLDIRNGREALSLHLAWKQKLLDGLRTNFNGINPNNDPLISWIENIQTFYGDDEQVEALKESFHFLFEQTKIIFDMLIQNADKDFAFGELLQSNSTFNSLSKIFTTQILALEQRREAQLKATSQKSAS